MAETHPKGKDMKVKDLIKQLKTMDAEHIVVMAKDGEGNSFSPVAEACGPYIYLAESTWSGEIINIEDNEDDHKPNAVVIWPTN